MVMFSGLSSEFSFSAIALLNHFAQTIRRIDKRILAYSGDKHFEYIDDPEMAQEEPQANEGPVPDFEQSLYNLTNPELLSALDLALLELEKRLFRYAKVGPGLLEMADEGLVLAARAKARLGQSLSAAQHTEGHLQVVGVGEWRPTSTRPAWNAEPRLPGSEEDS
jgi:hypothetical protein